MRILAQYGQPDLWAPVRDATVARHSWRWSRAHTHHATNAAPESTSIEERAFFGLHSAATSGCSTASEVTIDTRFLPQKGQPRSRTVRFAIVDSHS
jgi:hypothetical protein